MPGLLPAVPLPRIISEGNTLAQPSLLLSGRHQESPAISQARQHAAVSEVSTRGSSSKGEEGLRTGTTTPGDAEGGQLGMPNCSSQHKRPGASLPCTRPTREDFTRHLLAAVWHLPTALLILNPSGVLQQAKRRAPDTPAACSAPVRSKLARQPAGYLQEHAPVHGLTEESQKP